MCDTNVIVSLTVGVYYVFCVVFFFKQKTAYEMRISDWSSDVCSSDLAEISLRGGSLGCGTTRLGDLELRRRRLWPAGSRPATKRAGHLTAQPGQEIGRAHV